MAQWKQLRYRLEYWACAALARIIPHVPRGICAALARGLGFLAYYLDARGRGVALENIACAFGSRFSPAERVQIARRSYQNFARTMIDLFWITHLTVQNWRDYTDLTVHPDAESVIAGEKRPILFISFHFGNWEWAHVLAGFMGYRPLSVTERFKNPDLGAIFARLREHGGGSLVSQEHAMIRFLKAMKRGPARTALMADLSFRPGSGTTVVECFGMLVSVPKLPALLVKSCGAVVVPMLGESLPDGRCRVVVHAPVDVSSDASEREIVQACWDSVSGEIAERPEDYLWPYKHFRYRPADAQVPYPAYANESNLFEKALKASLKK